MKSHSYNRRYHFGKRFSMIFARILTILPLMIPGLAISGITNSWPGVVKQAQGQTVYFNAWGGSTRTNDYIRWVGGQLKARYGVSLVQVKLGDTAQAVSRVLEEKRAGNQTQGTVDLIWINGENFAALKKADLLYGPWTDELPNYKLTDPQNNPEVRTDFTVPTDGYEAPWNKAQIVFFYDRALTKNPPRTMPELLIWAKRNPGQFSYPAPPQFLGTAFLEQALIGLTRDPKVLGRPVSDADFDAVTAPLWHFLDELHPYLWRSGKSFPANAPDMVRLMGDGELSLAFSFNPSQVPEAIANDELPHTVKSYVLEGGMIGNVSFLAIPFNAPHKAGAMVAANFMLSPVAQSQKQDPRNWGGLTVLAMSSLSGQQRALFTALPKPAGGLSPKQLQDTLPEPDPSWVDALESAWRKRYTPH